jgi:hypothetical protein
MEQTGQSTTNNLKGLKSITIYKFLGNFMFISIVNQRTKTKQDDTQQEVEKRVILNTGVVVAVRAR